MLHQILELFVLFWDLCDHSLYRRWGKKQNKLLYFPNQKGVVPTSGGHIVNTKTVELGEIN